MKRKRKGRGLLTRSTRRVDGSMVDLAMNLKTLSKKIRKLETRLQEGPQKLARLKRKLEAMTKAKARKAKKKSAVQAAAVGGTTKASGSTQREKGRSTRQSQTKAVVVAQERTPARKAKRKLNLSPERRAQLAAAMKARWAAKRAAAGGNPKNGSTEGNSGSRQDPGSA